MLLFDKVAEYHIGSCGGIKPLTNENIIDREAGRLSEYVKLKRQLKGQDMPKPVLHSRGVTEYCFVSCRDGCR
jgi:hypothetical protein